VESTSGQSHYIVQSLPERAVDLHGRCCRIAQAKHMARLSQGADLQGIDDHALYRAQARDRLMRPYDGA